MDQFPIMLTAAFVLGLGVRFVGLPPLVGFLLAGFGLNLAGYVSSPQLEGAADLGVCKHKTVLLPRFLLSGVHTAELLHTEWRCLLGRGLVE